jgi:type IV pilus assembly protein PilB
MLEKLGQILLREFCITPDVLEEALVKSRGMGLRLGEYLIQQRGVSEELIYHALARQFNMDFIENLEKAVDKELLRNLPMELFRNGGCFPLYRKEDLLGIVVGDPLDMEIIMEVACQGDLVIQTSLAMPSAMVLLARKLFQGESVFRDSIGKISREFETSLKKEETQLSLDEIRKNTESEPVVKMATLIFNEAISQRVSDIHIEPLENRAVIRFRIDGMLRQHMELTKWMFSPLTSRVKILAELDIAEKRVPQDGRIRYTLQGQTFDFRVSTLPTHYGEKTVIRILKHDLSFLDLKNIGMGTVELAQLYACIEKPQGMIFVTGPTGSGKSSTLFACLNRIRRKAINITTIENPIEYKLEGVNQVQVNEKAGVTFATTLRSILRQDPDVILIGEIRDRETADIAIQASQTGHLVLSTLHTNDAVSAVTRLKDLGVPGFMVSSSLLAVVGQRLVRVLCNACKRKEPLSAELKVRWQKIFGVLPFEEAYIPIGCPKCNTIGYLGREGIFELFLVNDDVRSIVTNSTSEMELRDYLRNAGTKSMIQNGVDKIIAGRTTPDEVLRVVLVDEGFE